MKKIFIYITLLISSVAISQNYNMNATDVTTCSGTFYDSGGNGGNYANNQTITKTFCPSTPGAAIRFVFTQFSLENNADFLYIYDGDSTTAPLIDTYTGSTIPLVVQPSATNPTGCITFVFISDATNVSSGWSATISCQVACQSITASLDSTVPAVNGNGVIRATINQNITFNGSATFSTTGVGATYTWNFDDGTSASGTSVTHSYPNPGIYRVNLQVRDAVDCINSNRIDQFVHVSPIPTINFNSYNTETCPDIPLDITAVVDNFDLPGSYTGTPYVYTCTDPVVGETFLPDGNGVSYETSTLVSCYEPSAVITNINQIQQICLNMEHSYLGDLQIELISPNGQSIILLPFDSSGPAGLSTYLGHPWDGSTQSNGAGIGLTYCFTPSATTLLSNGMGMAAINQPGTTIVPGNYMPFQSFNGLLGSPLNGIWTIKVTDDQGSDDGYIFGWNIDFDPALYPANYTFTPQLISQVWSPDPTIINTVDNTITIQSSATNTTQTYTFNVTDDTGNTFSAPFDIDILDFPLINPTPPDLYCAACDLNDNNPFVIDSSLNYLDYDFTFYLSLQDAIDQVNGISNIYNLPAGASVQVWVRIEDFLLECPSYNSFWINNPACGLSLLSPTGTDNQNPCLNSSIQDVVFTTTGGVTNVVLTNGILPSGLTGTFDTTTGEYTISGIPSEVGSFTVTVSTVGCSTEVTHDVSLTITSQVQATFDPIPAQCEGGSNPLPSISLEGFSGTWSPTFDANNSGSYVFTPDTTVAGQECALPSNAVSVTITPQVQATFDPIPTQCSGGANPLPANSLEGFSGTWSPAFDANNTGSYVFTPDTTVAGQECALPSNAVSVTITPQVQATFDPIPAQCEGGSNPLPSTSLEGWSGTWSPVFDANNSGSYVFTPDTTVAGQECALPSNAVSVTITPQAQATFDPIPTQCANGANPLPSTSLEGWSGTWSPAFDANNSGSYVFTPDTTVAGQECALPSNAVSVTITPQVQATFDPIPAQCSGGASPLPANSLEGFSGTWLPAFDANNTGSYVFTPDTTVAGQECALPSNAVSVTITPQVQATFDPIPAQCEGGTNPLPSTSLEGWSGTWSPAFDVNNSGSYVFTPDTSVVGQECALPSNPVAVTITPFVQATFNAIPTQCANGSNPLPSTSLEGFSGTWSPAFDANNSGSYVFTPDTTVAGQECALPSNAVSVTITPQVQARFDPIPAQCAGGNNPLPST